MSKNPPKFHTGFIQTQCFAYLEVSFVALACCCQECSICFRTHFGILPLFSISTCNTVRKQEWPFDHLCERVDYTYRRRLMLYLNLRRGYKARPVFEFFCWQFILYLANLAISLCIRTCDSQRFRVTRLALGLLCQHTKDPFTGNFKSIY